VIKFIHAADIHLDSPLHGLSRYEGAPVREIRKATRKALANLVEYILEHRIPLLLIAGDIYDGDCPDFQTLLHFSGQMARLKDAGTKVALIRGNHDARNRMTKSLNLPDNVHTFSSRQPETWKLPDLGVAIHGQSYDREAVLDNLVLGYPDPVPGMFNIGLLHTSLTGRPGHSRYAPCEMKHLLARGYDYWALGHVHRHEIIHDNPMVIFSGCIQGRHIREQGIKGCMRAEVESSGKVNFEHVELDVLRWQTLEMDLSGLDSQARVLEALEQELKILLADQRRERLLALRIVLSGSSPDHSGLTRDFQQLQAEIRNLAMNISGQTIWVEKIINQTAPALDWEELKKSQTPQGNLIDYIERLLQDSEEFDALNPDLTELKAKLAGTGIDLPDLTDFETRRDLLHKSRDMLITLMAQKMPGSDHSS